MEGLLQQLLAGREHVVAAAWLLNAAAAAAEARLHATVAEAVGALGAAKTAARAEFLELSAAFDCAADAVGDSLALLASPAGFWSAGGTLPSTGTLCEVVPAAAPLPPMPRLRSAVKLEFLAAPAHPVFRVATEVRVVDADTLEVIAREPVARPGTDLRAPTRSVPVPSLHAKAMAVAPAGNEVAVLTEGTIWLAGAPAYEWRSRRRRRPLVSLAYQADGLLVELAVTGTVCAAGAPRLAFEPWAGALAVGGATAVLGGAVYHVPGGHAPWVKIAYLDFGVDVATPRPVVPVVDAECPGTRRAAVSACGSLIVAVWGPPHCGTDVWELRSRGSDGARRAVHTFTCPGMYGPVAITTSGECVVAEPGMLVARHPGNWAVLPNSRFAAGPVQALGAAAAAGALWVLRPGVLEVY